MPHKDLLRDFTPASREEWINKIEKDLRDRDFSSLITHTADGIAIEPAYMATDVDPKPQPFREKLQWDTVQEILVMDVKASNEEALNHLKRGATALLFYMMGNEDLEVLLKGIQLQHIRLNLVVQDDAAGTAGRLKQLIEKRGLQSTEIAGSINHDPLENLARTGNWFKDEETDFAELKEVRQKTTGSLKSLSLNVNLFANAGATLSQQLGIALAMAYETQHKLQAKDLREFWVNFAVGSNFFGEIAKLRAFRRIWSQLNSELGFDESQPAIYAESAMRNKTIKDAYNNMIRTTSEAMAAVIGGADEIAVKSFNRAFGEPTAFSERIALNQSSILQHESHLDAVKDIAQGSYFIEHLTEQLADKGWEFFKEIEAEGGFVEAMKKGWLQGKTEEAAEKEQKAFDAQQKVLIGANKHAVENEDLEDIIQQGQFFRESEKKTEVRPIKVKRLSEGIEAQQI